jgi:hypothetical protein
VSGSRSVEELLVRWSVQRGVPFALDAAVGLALPGLLIGLVAWIILPCLITCSSLRGEWSAVHAYIREGNNGCHQFEPCFDCKNNAKSANPASRRAPPPSPRARTPTASG